MPPSRANPDSSGGLLLGAPRNSGPRSWHRYFFITVARTIPTCGSGARGDWDDCLANKPPAPFCRCSATATKRSVSKQCAPLAPSVFKKPYPAFSSSLRVTRPTCDGKPFARSPRYRIRERWTRSSIRFLHRVPGCEPPVCGRLPSRTATRSGSCWQEWTPTAIGACEPAWRGCWVKLAETAPSPC